MKSLVAAALMLVCADATSAAQPAAEVTGSVFDQTGAPLPGVHVTILGGADRTAATGAAGDFAFPDLPQGHYEAGSTHAMACDSRGSIAPDSSRHR